jgi:hypothetical protein
MSVCLFVCLSVCLFVRHLDTVRPNAMKFGREYPFVQRKVETRLSEPKVGFWVGFSKFSGKPYENFFDFSKNLKIQRKVETRLAEPKVGFWVGFSKFSGKPYENFFDFSKNLKIFPTVRLLSSRFYLFALSLGREVPFDPKLSLPRYIDIYIYKEECLSVCSLCIRSL